jgi:hypothetical protein
MKIRASVIGITAVMGLVMCAITSAQDLQLHLTYVCNGERLFIENCNMQNLSDTANCFVGHPDTILSNGMMKYANETRGSLKKLLPTCKQPSAHEIAKEKAFTKKVEAFIDGGVLVNCSFLSPNQQNYRIEFKNGRTAIIVDTTPKPLVLTLTADGTIAGPGPLQIDGVVATGYTSGGDGRSSYSCGYHDQYVNSISNSAAAASYAYRGGGAR